MKFCESLPTLEEIYETSKFSSFPKPMEEASLPSNLNSKYHSIYDIQNLKIQKNFNIFHANVNGLESKFDNLHTFLAGIIIIIYPICKNLGLTYIKIYSRAALAAGIVLPVIHFSLYSVCCTASSERIPHF